MRHYWPIRSELPLIDGIAMKDKKNNDSSFITEAVTSEITQQSYGYREDRAIKAQMDILNEYECRHEKHCKRVLPLWSTSKHNHMRRQYGMRCDESHGKLLVPIYSLLRINTLLYLVDCYSKVPI